MKLEENIDLVRTDAIDVPNIFISRRSQNIELCETTSTEYY